ncbi:MAG: hypothetical protein L3J24_09470 [Xanthomonadales bacterium]|nr:hypothetical protein [Xanthomonadales bacterium]
MPIKTQDRPIKNIREEVIDQLVMNYAHQEITLDAFESRLDLAMDTEDRNILLEQVADLDLNTDNQYQKTKADKLSSDKNYFDDDFSGHEKFVKILSSAEQSGRWVVPEKIKVTSVLSSFTLDFTDAVFSSPVVHIKMFNLLTGNIIYVPEDVRVVCKTSSYLSSLNQSVFGSTDENAQTIIIHGNCILSSMDIEIRITLKEKWLNFADNVKNLFN